MAGGSQRTSASEPAYAWQVVFQPGHNEMISRTHQLESVIDNAIKKVVFRPTLV